MNQAELRMRKVRNETWTAGRLAGLREQGIGTNPYAAGDELSDVWELGYRTGRRERAERT